MDKLVTIRLPAIIYDLYADIATGFGDVTAEELMSCMLHACAEHLVEDMMTEGEIPSVKPKIELYTGDVE